jgi:catechol 2,3-dioxygenase-like lactoylglutathione lyase family enzyme
VTDRAVPNLPSRDLAETAAFYQSFGFNELHRDDSWLVLRRGELQLEFFRKEDHEPRGHDFGCCLRVADLQTLYAAVLAAGIPEERYGLPSVRPIATQPWGQQMSTLLDPDGNLLRMIADDDTR